MSEQEKKNKRAGVIISGIFHGILLIIFIFLIAWRPPNPPLPEYGIELNFGLDQQGSGDIQRLNPQRVSQSEEDARPEPPKAQAEQQSEQEPVPTKTQAAAETKPVEAPKPEPKSEPVKTIQPEVTQKEASVKVDEKSAPKQEETKEIKKVEEKPVTPPKEVVKEEVKTVTEASKTTPPKTEEVKKETQTQTTTTGTGGGGQTGTTSTAKANNQGDDKNITGDKGNPQGSVDARALYGTQGGGGDGASLDLAGWAWDFLPKPKDESSESGRIVFEIKIDDRGYIQSIRTLEKTVSPAVEKIYRQEVERLTFSKTSSNTRPAPISTGKITFIIRSR
jgi:periplasmic protein TonB